MTYRDLLRNPISGKVPPALSGVQPRNRSPWVDWGNTLDKGFAGLFSGNQPLTTPTPTPAPEQDPFAFLGQATSPEELNAMLLELAQRGIITPEEGDALQAKYYWQAQNNFLGQYTSHRDLEDKIEGLDLDDAVKAELYDQTLKNTRSVFEARYRNPENGRVNKDLVKQAESQDLALRAARGRRMAVERQQRELAEEAAYKNQPTYLTDSQMNRVAIPASQGVDLGALLNSSLFLQQSRDNGAGQRNEALLNTMQQPRRTPGEFVGALGGGRGAQQPDAGRTLMELLGGTGLAQGTRLRSFIESELPGMERENRGARQSWWGAMSGGSGGSPTYEDEQQRLRNEAAGWQGVAANASGDALSGGVYYGEGGLKAIAEAAYQNALNNLGNLTGAPEPEDSDPMQARIKSMARGNEPVTPYEDPLKTAYRNRNWWAEYNRQPGTGQANRLTPAARY